MIANDSRYCGGTFRRLQGDNGQKSTAASVDMRKEQVPLFEAWLVAGSHHNLGIGLLFRG